MARNPETGKIMVAITGWRKDEGLLDLGTNRVTVEEMVDCSRCVLRKYVNCSGLDGLGRAKLRVSKAKSLRGLVAGEEKRLKPVNLRIFSEYFNPDLRRVNLRCNLDEVIIHHEVFGTVKYDETKDLEKFHGYIRQQDNRKIGGVLREAKKERFLRTFGLGKKKIREEND